MAVKEGDIRYHKTTGDKVVVIEIKPKGILECRLPDRSVIEYHESELQDANPRGGADLDLYN